MYIYTCIKLMEKFHGVTFCCNACVYASWSNLSERLARSSNGRRRLVPGIVSRKLERVSQTASGELSLSGGNAAFKSFSRLKIRWHEITRLTHTHTYTQPCWLRYKTVESGPRPTFLYHRRPSSSKRSLANFSPR